MKLPQDKTNTVSYVLHCEACSYHGVVSDKDKFNTTEISLASVPRGIPQLVSGKIETQKPIPRKKMFKCPGCGRGVAVKTCTVKKSFHEDKKDGKEGNSARRETGPFGQPLS